MFGHTTLRPNAYRAVAIANAMGSTMSVEYIQPAWVASPTAFDQVEYTTGLCRMTQDKRCYLRPLCTVRDPYRSHQWPDRRQEFTDRKPHRALIRGLDRTRKSSRRVDSFTNQVSNCGLNGPDYTANHDRAANRRSGKVAKPLSAYISFSAAFGRSWAIREPHRQELVDRLVRTESPAQ